DDWISGGKPALWKKELNKLSQRLKAAIRAPIPTRHAQPIAHRETLAEFILAVAEDSNGTRRAELQKKLSAVSNPDRTVGGKWQGEVLNRLTPLHWVASRGLLPEARILIERGATVSVELPFISSPIEFAMENNHRDMVAYLLTAGADRVKALFSAIGDE